MNFDLLVMSVAASGSADNIAVGGVVGVHHTADGGKPVMILQRTFFE